MLGKYLRLLCLLNFGLFSKVRGHPKPMKEKGACTRRLSINKQQIAPSWELKASNICGGAQMYAWGQALLSPFNLIATPVAVSRPTNEHTTQTCSSVAPWLFSTIMIYWSNRRWQNTEGKQIKLVLPHSCPYLLTKHWCGYKYKSDKKFKRTPMRFSRIQTSP